MQEKVGLRRRIKAEEWKKTLSRTSIQFLRCNKSFNRQILDGKISADDRNNYNDKAFTNWNENVLEPCQNCGRTFLPDRLKIHLKSCDKNGSHSH